MGSSREGTPERTQRKDTGKEVRKEGSPRPLQTDQITDVTRSREGSRERSKTPVEQLAEMSERVMTPKSETSRQDNSSDSSNSESRARRDEITRGKRKARTPEEGEFERGEPKAKRTKLDSGEEGNKTPESQYEWPEYNPTAYVSDTSNRAGSDMSHEEDNPLKDEKEILDDHIENFRRYDEGNRKDLEAALEYLNIDRKTIEETITNSRHVIEANSPGTAKDILEATNRQFHDLENVVEIEISKREEREGSD